MNNLTKSLVAIGLSVPMVLAGGVAQAAPGLNAPGANASGVDTKSLQYMVAEEKLAHDVYVTLGEAFSLRVFDNIARAELTHMEAVRDLLDTYNIVDPTVGDKLGVFDDPDLQALYNKLVKQGLESRTAALQVGVVIEKLDIADLKESLEENSAADVERVLNSLLRGSYRHLNAFERNLSR
jgi:hypothetical protein